MKILSGRKEPTVSPLGRIGAIVFGALLASCLVVVIKQSVSAKELIRIDGIPVPQSQLAINRGIKPKKHHFFGYHFPPVRSDPSPYIILMPGCGGLGSRENNTLFSYADDFVRRGYGAIVVDILRDTGIDHTCTHATGPSYTLAALSSAHHAHLMNWSSGRFGIVGQSKGAIAAIRLSSAEARTMSIYENVENWFGAAVAFYPWCSDTRLVNPVLVLIGNEDDWTPAVHCRRWLESGSADRLEVRFYPGAHHAFDAKNLELQTEFGFHIGSNPTAARDARRRMLEFFDKHLK